MTAARLLLILGKWYVEVTSNCFRQHLHADWEKGNQYFKHYIIQVVLMRILQRNLASKATRLFTVMAILGPQMMSSESHLMLIAAICILQERRSQNSGTAAFTRF